MHEAQILDSKPVHGDEGRSPLSLALTSMQQAMLFDELALNSPAVNFLQVPVKLSPGADRGRFVAALTAELELQPATRITFTPDITRAAGLAEQILSGGLTALPLWETSAPQAPWRQAPGFQDRQLVRVIAGDGADEDGNTVWLTCHHAVADRPGVEAIIRRAALRYAGQVPPPAGSYPAALAAIAARTVQPVPDEAGSEADSSDHLADADRIDAMACSDRDPRMTLEVERLRQAVTAADWDRLSSFARTMRLSEQQLVAALAHAALDRCRDAGPTLLGIPVSLRDALPDPELLGCFIGTIGLTAPGSASRASGDYLLAWRDRFFDHFESRWLPAFGRSDRSRQRQAFAMLFAWHDHCRTDLGDGAAIVGMAEPYPGRTALTLSAQPGQDGLALALDFDPGRIDAAAAGGLLNGLAIALHRLAKAAAPETVDLDTLFDPGSTARAASEPSPPRIFAALARHAAVRAAHPALQAADGTSFTFAELDLAMTRASAWARTAPSGSIGLVMRRSPAAFAVLLGMLKAGRTVALLDPELACEALRQTAQVHAATCAFALDAERLERAFVIEDILAEAAAAQEAAGTDGSGSGCDDDRSDDDLSDKAGIVIYTSGSTGAARPVLLGFESVARHAGWAAAAFELTARDRVLQFCAVTFDAMLEELLPALLVGATVVLRSEAAAHGGAGLLGFCAEQNISVVDLPTGFFNLADSDLDRTAWPRSLRLIVIGGEAYQGDALARWLDAASANGCAICTSYGPTEATVVVSFVRLDAGDPAALIGAPRPGNMLLVLDRQFRPAMPGCTGELFLAGTALARGYLGRAGDTADRFVPNPHGSPGSVMYRTGDRVRIAADGRLHFAGRLDDQVKISGRRFEIGRTERMLAELAGAPVILHVPQQAGAMPQIWAGCAPDSDGARQVKAAVAAMPAWHRPNLLRFGPVPLTPRGKLDRRAAARLLEAEAKSTPANGADGLPPEPVLPELALIAEVLGRSSVAPGDNFLQLGGNSLNVLRLASFCRTRLGKAPAISALFGDMTLAAMCSVIRDAPIASGMPGPSVKPGGTDDRAEGWQVSPYEAALYLDAAKGGDGEAYQISAQWRVSALLDPDRFVAAANAVRDRHPLLSAQIVEDGGNLTWRKAERGGPGWTDPVTRLDLALDQAASCSTITLQTSHLVCDDAAIERVIMDLARAYDQGPDCLGSAQIPPPPPHRPDLSGAWQGQFLAGYSSLLPKTAGPQATASAGYETQAYHVAAADRAGGPDQSITDFVLALAPVLTWLSRACGEDGALVWTPVRVTAVDGVRLGITTLPLSLPTPASATLRELGQALQGQLAWVFDHREIDPASLASSGLAGSAGLSVLFDLTDERQAAVARFAGEAAQAVSLPVKTVRADIEIAAQITPRGDLTYRLRGRTSAYEPDVLEAWAQSIAWFAAGLRADPGRPQAAIPLCPPHDPGQSDPGSILPGRQDAINPPGQSLSAMLRASLGRGTAVRIIGEAAHHSGADVLAEAARIAGELKALGASAGDVIEIALPRSAAYPAALLAVWENGAVPVLINPDQPAALQARMREVSQAGFRIDAPDIAAPAKASRLAGSRQRLDGAKLAYGAFTSGTTGLPKLVLIEWQGLRQLLGWARTALPMTEHDRFLHVAAPGFDIGLFEMLHPLLSDAALVIAGRIDDPVALAAFAERSGATHLHFVPALLGAFLDASSPAALARVRLVMCGGDTVPVALAKRVLEGGMQFQHCYGPTETTIFVASAAITAADLARDFLPLGQPVSGSGLMVCDRMGQVLPKGLPGELLVYGDSLASGYFADGRMTADRFVPTGRDGARMYHTGDRAVIGADGALRHLGRIDRQLKISGVRLEPAAIEAALEAHQKVEKAAVFALERAGRAVLAAVVKTAPLPEAEAQKLTAALREAIRSRFHAAAVPGLLLLQPDLPTTANGKVDHAALRILAGQHSEAGRSGSAPTNLTAHDPRLAALLPIWTGILGLEAEPETDFFGAGGDSMAAIRMVAQAARAGLAFSIADIFRHPTPGRLIALLNAREAAAQHEFHQPAAAGTLAPLAPAARDWLSRTAAFGPGDVLAVHAEIPPAADGAAVADALAALIVHHDALRIAVTAESNEWVSRFGAPYRPECPVAANSEAALASAIAAVNPQGGQMLGAAMVQGKPGAVILAVHHLAIDPGGWNALVADLIQLLNPERVRRLRARPFSASCAERPPELARTSRPTSPLPPRLQITRQLSGWELSQDQVTRSVKAGLFDHFGARQAVIATERPGRAEADEGCIGWFTDFAVIDPTSGAKTAEPSKEAAERRVDVLINLAIPGAVPTDWTPLQADIAPVHPLAIEISPGTGGTTDWSLTLSAGQDWSAADVEQLAAAIVGSLTGPGDVVRISPTPLQLAMLMASTSGSSRSAYHTQIVFVPEGQVDPDCLVAAWQDCHARHDALRLRMVIGEDDPLPGLAITPIHADRPDWATRIADHARPVEDLLAQFLARDLAQSFGAGEPLSRVALLSGNNGMRLVWSHHHALLDGWSLNLVTQSVAQCYTARVGAAASALHAPSIRPFMRWWQEQPQAALERAAHDLVACWPRGLAGSGRARSTAARASSFAQLDAQTTAALRAQARTTGATLFELCLAALAIVDAQRQGDGAGMFRFIASLRPDEIPDIAETVGLCMNVLPLRIPVSRSLTDLLAQVRYRLAEVMEIAAVSPFAVASALRDAGLEPRFDTVVVFENYPGDRRGVPLGENGFMRVCSAREEGEARFTLVIMPDAELNVELLHPDDPAATDEAKAMLAGLSKVLSHFAKLNAALNAEKTAGA